MVATPAVARKDEPVSDERVVFTKRNWTGRFLRAEVSYGDFQQIMAGIQTWDQWLPAWSRKAQEYERLAEAAEQRGARQSAADGWQLVRESRTRDPRPATVECLL
jgi:hypothetical protein